MTKEQLEQRLDKIERTVSDLVSRFDSLQPIDPKSKWWERVPPLSDEQIKAWDDIDAYGRYYRQTGRDAPDGWKPGDPIPEPDAAWLGMEETEHQS